VKLISIPDGKEVLHLEGLHEDRIMSVSFNPAGTLLATGSQDKSVKLISVVKGNDDFGKMMLHLPGLHEDDINSVLFNPAGTLLITGSEDWGCTIGSWSSLASLDHNFPNAWPRVLPPDHPACCPSLRQCASLRARAEARAASSLAPRVAACLVRAIRNFPVLLAMPSSTSFERLLLDVLKNDDTPDIILDEVIASLSLPDGAPRPITLAPDADGKSALRYALEADPPDRPAIKAILESASAGFATEFGFAYREEASTLYEDVLFLAEEVPNCLDLLVASLLNSAGALTRSPAERQIERVKHDFDETGPLTEAGNRAYEAPFQRFVVVNKTGEDDSGVASMLLGDVKDALEDVLGDALLHGNQGVVEAHPVDTSLAMLSIPCISQTPAPKTKGQKSRCLLAILLDAKFVAAFETPAIRLLVEHQWKTFGRRYAIIELVAFLATFFTPFIVFVVFLAKIPHGANFGDTISYPAAVAYVLCLPWLLRHAYLEVNQFRRIGLIRYIKSLWNVADSSLVLTFGAVGILLALDQWLAGKYLAVASTLLVFLKAASQVGMLGLFSGSSDSVLTLLACWSATGFLTIWHAGADGGGLLRGLALLLAGADHSHRWLRRRLHAARWGHLRRERTA
jgi:hypothetical protein